MPFAHSIAQTWGRWLRRADASRPPNSQVTGQLIEDDLRAVIQAIDVRHLTTPIGWAQAAAGRSVGATALELSRVELHCLSEGGLWLTDLNASPAAFLRMADAPLGATNRTGIVDFGNIPTLSQLAEASIVEGDLSNDLPSIPDVLGRPGLASPIFVPFGRVLVMSPRFRNTAFVPSLIAWREIP